ncbi:MAG: 9-O-acetylesterase [Planctomycetota bacterium]|nr:9-O-acetylesterase [Planctomycetota bacterium]
MNTKHAPIVVALIALSAVAFADVRLPSVFGSGMVLQRDTQAPVWGWADPGERVTVRASWLQDELAATADADGRWMVRLATPEAGGPHTVRVAGANEVLLEDVWSGEVWICSGQSNMAWSLRAATNAEEEIAAADHPGIRFFDVANALSLEPAEDCEGTWRVCSPETISGFSAVGYFFGRELSRELGVPIGLIGTSWGGTVAEAWTSAETLRGFPEFGAALDRIDGALRASDAEPSLADLQAAWWDNLEAKDPGANGGWMAPVLDEAAWKPVQVPGTWSEIDMQGFDGCVWYRRTVEIPADWTGQDLVLEIGPVDDMDLTWFNGELVGETRGAGKHATPRSYAVPAAVVRADALNVIAVCAVDTGGVGRLGSDPDGMRLRIAESESAPLPLSGTWLYRAGATLSDLGGWPRDTWFHRNYVTALHNGMIAPLVPFAIRGAIWYQGESNRPRSVQYRELFPAMIRDWRAKWGRGDFPFYFVQLAPFEYGGDQGELSELREAQTMALAVPNTGMAVTMDIGNPKDIHPRNKQEVGRRLALWALARDYGREGLVHSGPLYRSMQIEGSTIRLSFDHAEGLVARHGALTHFTIAGKNREFHPAEAVTDGSTIVVSSIGVLRPVAARFAWGATDEPNLFNGAGLPAPSFRTDDWPAVGQAQ